MIINYNNIILFVIFKDISLFYKTYVIAKNILW